MSQESKIAAPTDPTNVPEASGSVEEMPVDTSKKEIKVEDFVEYPDPDSQEEEEVEDEIDTGKIQEAMEKTKEENPLSLIMPLIPRNPTDDGMEDFQKMLMGIFSQFMGADAQGGQPNPDMESFMREFQAGFASGAAASNQYAQTTAQSENATVSPLFRFFFTASSGLSWAIASTD